MYWLCAGLPESTLSYLPQVQYSIYGITVFIMQIPHLPWLLRGVAEGYVTTVAEDMQVGVVYLTYTT